MKQILGFTTEDSLVNIEGQVVEIDSKDPIAWEHLGLMWTTTYSDGSQVELPVEDSRRGQRVAFADKEEYVLKALQMRLTESIPQCEAIRRGIAKIMPESLMNTVTYNELSVWVCGKTNIDIDLLKKVTVYVANGATSGEKYGPEHPTIIHFWEWLSNETDEMQKSFIKFCWGQERIPESQDAFDRAATNKFTIAAMGKHKSSQDERLITADTCFFKLNLPEYSTLEILKKKIVIAITTDNCGMNKDDNANNGGEAHAGRRAPPRRGGGSDEY